MVIALLISVGTDAAAQTKPHRTLLLEVSGVERDALSKGLFAYDDYGGAIISSLPGKISVLATEAERAVLLERGYDVQTIATDTSELNLRKRSLYGPSLELPPIYHTYERILEIGDSLMSVHPDLISRRQIGTTTQENRDIFAFRIASNVDADNDRPAIMFDGCHHADEIMGAQISTEIMQLLVAGYGNDDEITRWLDRYEIFIVPVVNVEGHYVVTHNIDPRWRKNTRDTDGDGILHEYRDGVDVNRNYDFNWAHGGSGDSTSSRFRGEHPFSESENRAMRSLASDRRFLLSISYHSQGEVVYYPWSWRGRPAPDDKLLTDIATGLASSIPTMIGDTTYNAEYGAGTVGQSYPWLYGRYGTFDFVVETGRGSHIFPPEYVPQIVSSNVAGAKYLLRRAAGPGLALKVRDADSGEPVQAEVWIPSIDSEEVDRRRTRDSGSHWRLLQPRTYSVHIAAPGFETSIVELEIAENGWSDTVVDLTK
jgi:carboxypeptidase T